MAPRPRWIRSKPFRPEPGSTQLPSPNPGQNALKDRHSRPRPWPRPQTLGTGQRGPPRLTIGQLGEYRTLVG